MNTDHIKSILVSAIGGHAKDWKRYAKFKFNNHKEFEEKEINNLDIGSLELADYNQGSLPNSGICRMFVSYIEDLGDTTAYVITSDDDSGITYISVSSD